ncbi:MAG: hypothetical protein AVDCRST_MAG19-769, partial [uncultured Thermomicrobiales bacterium]
AVLRPPGAAGVGRRLRAPGGGDPADGGAAALVRGPARDERADHASPAGDPVRGGVGGARRRPVDAARRSGHRRPGDRL